MSSNTDLALSLYDAINGRDGEALLAAMTEDFTGTVSAGMPLGVGGRYEGRDAMLGQVWLPVFQAFDVRLEVERTLESGDEVVVLGSYVGTRRDTGADFAARFAHVLTIAAGGISALEQITDTASWA